MASKPPLDGTSSASNPIESYAMIGDTQTAALVGADGSIDWLCLPRFDSGALFASILGDRSNGRWRIGPCDPAARSERRYRPDSLVLETTFTTASGVVRLIDCMPVRGEAPDVVRIVEGVSGQVEMEMDLVLRFDYGSTVPWARRVGDVLSFVAGPDAVELATPVELVGQEKATVASFSVGAGDRVPFVLTWHPSTGPQPHRVEPELAVEETDRWWRTWASHAAVGGPWREQVLRSLITLKALTYAPTGGIVAAPTTSLPEELGGVRNWDYRYCWLRDATFTLQALLAAGYEAEAIAWRDWLLRAVAGDPSQLQIMYSVLGERRLPEIELPWLAGYAGSRPVRIGNAAAAQRQLDVYGEVMDALHQARLAGIPADAPSWAMQQALLDWLATGWREPDFGLWEIRGAPRHFVHSKVMCWVAFDRGVRGVEECGLDGPVERWRAVRDEIHAEVCDRGWSDQRGSFTQSYDSEALDASLLVMPVVGFLPADEPRVLATIDAVRDELMVDGFLERYLIDDTVSADGIAGGEGTFLLCTFWLADALALAGRTDEATEIFERLLATTNDVGLLSEEYDPVAGHMLGNFPQAFSHLGLVNTALYLDRGRHPLGTPGRVGGRAVG